MKTLVIIGLILLSPVCSYPAVQSSVAAKRIQTNPAHSQSVMQAATKEKAPTFALPAGACVNMELNLNRSDILIMVIQSLPSFAKGFGDATGEVNEAIKMLDLNALTDAIQGIRALRLIQFKLKNAAEPSKVLPSFESQVKSWDRIFYYTTPANSEIIAIYSLNGKSYLGVMLNSETNDNYVIGTQGFIDLRKLSTWAGKALNVIMSLDEKSSLEDIQKQTNLFKSK